MGRAMGRTASRNIFGDFSMSTMTSANTDVLVLKSYLGGKWESGTGKGTILINPSTNQPLAFATANGLNLEKAFAYARNVGGPELRKIGYGQRAELLGKIADVLSSQRDRWFQ